MKKYDEAQELLLKRSSSLNIQKCIMLAIKYNFIDKFISDLIVRANRNTKEVNVLLEYIDYFSNPENIIAQYDPETKIGDIREKLITAFNKLDLYINLIQAAVRVSGA